MLTPSPSTCQSSPDSDVSNNYNSNNNNSDSYLVPSIPLAPGAWPSDTQDYNQHHQHRRIRSVPKARLSKLSRTSANQRHHHHRRPSKQFVATTSSAIFGDWDIELKIEHRTQTRPKAVNPDGKVSPQATTTAAATAGGGGGGNGGGPIIVGAGPGIHTAASGTPPLSTFPSTIPTSPSLPSPCSTHHTPAFNAIKGQSTHNNTTSSIAGATSNIPASAASTAAAAGKQLSKDDHIQGNGALPQTSARSSFLKALGKFKNKHLQQKRPSTPLPATTKMDPLTSTTNDKRASYIIPPIHFDGVETQPSQHILDTTTVLDEDMTGDIVKQPVIIVEEDVAAGGSSSLRVKLKNKVNHTLASMRSSSNLREKAKTQHSDSIDPSLHPEESSKLNERRKSALAVLFSEESRDDASTSSTVKTSGDKTPAQSKNRQSKISWTFPRVRSLEPSQGSRQQIPWGTTSNISNTGSTDISDTIDQHDTVMGSVETEQDGDGSTTLHQQLEELKVDELDSDHSLDIILPVDYEDYTQFAELPLKKRKKMERSLASNLAVVNGTKRPNSMRVSADVMRRFLTLPESSKKNNNKDGEGSTVESVEVLSRDAGAVNSNKKRPQASTESGQKLSKKTGQQTAEWRRSILKTLHLGKGQHSLRKQPAAKSVQDQSQGTALESVPEQQVSQSPSPDTTRLARSGSVRSTRSRSLTTSTHPALLATTLSKPRGQGLRRETLEMAMQRRRQSSAARSNFNGSETPLPLPLSSGFFDFDNISTTNITHTFTSFTLELADMHHAHEVINNSAVPGLFDFKRRQPRLTMSSNIMELDTDQEFKGFDSDGDAISGYTGDADVSMDDIQVPPKSPTTPRPSFSQFKARARLASSAAEQASRRKMSSVDGDSDTVPELPTLMIRTRDLNRSNSGRGAGGYSRSPRPQGGNFFGGEHGQQGNERDSPRSPRRVGATSPTGSRKTNHNNFGLGVETTSPTSPLSADPSSPSRAARAPMSMEEIASWKPRNIAPQGRPHVPTLDTKPLKVTRGSGLSSSTTLVPSSRTPYSDMLTESPMFISPTPGAEEQGPLHSHQPSLSTSSSHHYHHQSQISGETLVPYHLKNFSSGSTMSASSGPSAQTPTGFHPHQFQNKSSTDARPTIPGVREFDPDEEFSPTTPADLKAMDFEALLATAEREHQKGWEDLMASKRNEVAQTKTTISAFPQPPIVQPLKISSASKAKRSNPQTQQQEQQQRSTVAFDLGPSDDGTGTGTGTGSDRSTRSKRVMKKKMSVIRLTGNGNVQGRREGDGVIRVSMSSVAPSVPQPSQQQFWRD